MTSQHDLVLVVDFGAQYAQLIARRVREAHVYSEIIGSDASVDEIIARRPAAIILSGGPSSVYADEAPQLDPALFEAGIPVFGICYGFQAMAQALGGSVAKTGQREYGRTPLSIQNSGKLLATLPNTLNVWMSHGDSVSRAPEGFHVLARTAGAPVAAFECRMRKLAGVQWHPEVAHTQWGQQVLEHFLFHIAGLTPDWTPENMVSEAIADIRAQVGDSHVLCALSGGVDSAVAAALVQRAIGSQLTCVFVDHGLLREGEAKQVKEDFVEITGVDLVVAVAGAKMADVRTDGLGRDPHCERSQRLEQRASQVRTAWSHHGCRCGSQQGCRQCGIHQLMLGRLLQPREGIAARAPSRNRIQ